MAPFHKLTMRGRSQGRQCPTHVTKHIDWKLSMMEEQFHTSIWNYDTVWVFNYQRVKHL